MAYYSIVFPSVKSRELAADCAWLSYRIVRQRCDYIVQGNKTLPSSNHGLAEDTTSVPEFFADTLLDQVLNEVLISDKHENLRKIFYSLSTSMETVLFRQTIIRMLEIPEVMALFRTFCQEVEGALRTMADSQDVHLDIQRDQYIVDGSIAYCDAIRKLLTQASKMNFASCGLGDFVNAVMEYVQSPNYIQAERTVRHAKEQIAMIAFQISIEKGKIIVSDRQQETDLCKDTQAVFSLVDEDICKGEETGHEIRLFNQLNLNPLGVLIAGALQSLHSATFKELHRAAKTVIDLPAPFIQNFIRDIHFYFTYFDTAERLKSNGICFCLPKLSENNTIRVESAYDFALALKQETLVPNDFFLGMDECGAVVTGANHSGKTTFIRTLGQIAVLTALGLPVPCKYAELPLFHAFYSHFSDSEEAIADQGRLKSEANHMKRILTQAGNHSLVLLNEMFSSTTAHDAQAMTHQVLNTLVEAGACVLCVSHNIGEIPKRLVSMVSQVDLVNKQRLFKIIRSSVATHAYVDELIEKNHLTYDEIRERIQHEV